MSCKDIEEKILSELSDRNTIIATIEDIYLNSNQIIKIDARLSDYDLVREVELDGKFEVDKDSEFEMFLKEKGINPYRITIDELIGEKIEIEVKKHPSGDVSYKCYNRKINLRRKYNDII